MRPVTPHGAQVERNRETSEVAIANCYELAVRGEGAWVGNRQFDPMLGGHLGVFGPRGVVKPAPIIGMENDVRNSHGKSMADRVAARHGRDRARDLADSCPSPGL